MNENRSTEPTPEQLVKLLDLQIAIQRSRRKPTANTRVVWAGVVIFVLLVGTMAAFLYYQFKRDELLQRNQPNQVQDAMEFGR